MKKLIFLIFVVAAIPVLAQTGSISGRVIDSETLQGLPFANVFINNTTVGTATDVQGNFVLNNVPAGSAEVIYSFVGYKAYQTRTEVKDGQDVKVNIRLIPDQQQLGEVQVKASRDKAWEKQLKRFEKIFFGSTDLARECSIGNPYVLDFKEEGSKFSASASAPLEIRNGAMGYKVTYYLKSLTADGVQYMIVGNSRFEDLVPQTAEDAMRWMTNRRDAYLGSTRHLFKALIEGKSAERGYKLYTDRATDKTSRLSSFKADLEKAASVVPFSLEGVVSPGNSIYEKKIMLKGRLEVHYTEKPGATQVYKDIGYAVSWIEAKNGTITVNNDGVVSNSLDLVLSGDMGSTRVSSVLPLDYSPQQVLRIRTAAQVQAERLFEMVYLQTNKPFYYPGEMVWFKGYMDYNVRGNADTLSRILYVDVVNADRNRVRSKVVKIDSGRVSGNFKLPGDLPAGTYGLIAYTSWMRNYGESSYFRRVLPVLDIYDKVVSSDQPPVGRNSGEIEIALDKVSYKPREKVKVAVSLQDENNKPIKAALSVSVTDLGQVPYVAWAKNDIRRDLKMPVNIHMIGKVTYPIEYGITWNGEFQPGLKKAEKSNLTIVRGAFEEVKKVTTDISGRFSLTNLDVADSAAYNFQALRGKESYGKVVSMPYNSPILTFNAADYSIPIERKESVQRILSTYEVPADAILLNDIEIKATRLENREPSEVNAYGNADAVIREEEIALYGSIEALLRARAPGFRFFYDGVNWLFLSNKPQKVGEGLVTTFSSTGAVLSQYYAGGNLPEPMLTINNKQVFTGADNTVGDNLMRLNPMDIERIEVSGTANSFIGANGVYGLVAIFTKKGMMPDKNHFQKLFIKGYDTPQEFKGPNYADVSEDHSQGDFRSTLFWGRDIRVGSSGSSEFSFYTSDLPGKYRIVIEGVTEKGKPVHFEELVTVEQ